jgi:uncharacterized protein YecT (DUF1311 family)
MHHSYMMRKVPRTLVRKNVHMGEKKIMKTESENHADSKAIWNPNAAANWSFIFTPAFGSYLQMKNWNALGESSKATAAKIWFYVSLLVLITIAIVQVVALKAGAEASTGGLALLFLLIWYFAAGRAQAKYVKATLGQDYARKSWTKPLLIALTCMVAYWVFLAALMAVATTAEAHDETGSTSAFSLGSLFGHKELNCADQDAKDAVTDYFSDTLAEADIPDLTLAIEQKRVKFDLQMVAETSRDQESKFITCSGYVVAEFPKEDIEKATKLAGSSFVAKAMPTDPVFQSKFVYKLSTPADEKEKGPLIEMKAVDGRGDGQRLLPYTTAYGMLAHSVQDITPATTNATPWDAHWKKAVVEECAKDADPKLCQCRLDEYEKVLSQIDMRRITFIVKNGGATQYPKFVEMQEGLDQQCPLPKQVVAPSAPVEQATTPTPAPQPVVAPAPETPSAATGEIKASFDCAKAVSKIEKLICSSPETANADKRLTSTYSTARSHSDDPQRLKTEQMTWMKEKRNVCDDVKCLIGVTENRIQELSK